MISVIVAPETAQQIFTPPTQPRPTPRLDSVDQRIVEAVREHGPVKLWSLLNWLAEDEGARSRDEERQARLDLWRYRIKRLKWLGLVFGRGRNELAAVKPDRQPTRPRPRPRRRRRTVAKAPDFPAVSAGKSPSLPEQPDFNYLVKRHLTAKDSVISHEVERPEKTESVSTTEHVSAAARALATLPRRKSRKWTGWLHGEHFWRGRPVVLPNGEVTEVYWTSRGRVLLTDANDLPYPKWRLRVARREQDVRLYRHPAAVLLGGRKRGIKEAPSALKAAACRVNGRRPVRAGGRPRGRPRRSAVS